MENAENRSETAARIVREAREVASSIPFDERADLIRGVVHSVLEAVKFDPTIGGAPRGAQWEKDGLAKVADAAEDYWHSVLEAKRERG